MRSRTIAQNTLWIGLDTAFSFASNATLSIVGARLLGPALLGPYNYTLWATGLAAFLVNLGVPAATGNFASELVGNGRVGQALGVVRAGLRFQAIFATTVVAVGCAAVLAFVSGEYRIFSSLLLLSLAPAAMMGVFASAINATEEGLANVWPSILSTAVCLIGSLYALIQWRSLVGLTAAFLAGRVLDCILRAIAFRRVYTRRWPGVTAETPPREVYVRLRRFSAAATVLSLLAALVWDRSDIYFVKRFWDAREVAFYSLGANLAFQVLNLPQVFLNAAAMTMRVEQGRNPEGLGRFVGTTAYYVILLTLPLGLGLAALSPVLVPLVYGEAYKPAIWPLAVASLFVVSKALLIHVRNVLLLREEYVFLIGLGAATGLLGVVLNLWLVPFAGATGGAFSNGVYHTAAAAAGWLLVARGLKANMPWQRLAKAAGAAVAMGGAVGLMLLRFPGWIALALAVPLGAVVYALGLRALNCLDTADARRLEAFSSAIPPPLRRGFVRVVQLAGHN